MLVCISGFRVESFTNPVLQKKSLIDVDKLVYPLFSGLQCLGKYNQQFIYDVKQIILGCLSFCRVLS